MAPNPIACSHRIRVPIVVSGQTHEHDLFVHADAGGIDYQLIHQLSTNQNWQDDIDHYLSVIAPLFHTSVTFGTAHLDAYIAGAYAPISYHTSPTTSGSSSGVSRLASQMTVTMRDTARRFVKLIYLETGYLNPYKKVTRPLGDATLDAVLNDIFSPAGSNDTGFWLRSRSEYFVSSFTSLVVTDNNRLRRDRGL